MNKMIKCCFCKKEIESVYSNNAEPIMNGRCCRECNNEKVIPMRIYNMMKGRK